MLKVLLVKTSSLGDVVHNLPVVTDIRRQFPDALIDWAVEEAYAPLVRLHPAVQGIVTVAIRRWRTRPLARSTWSEIGAMWRSIRAQQYDAVIDTQGLIKSALLARTARGRHHGYDETCAREGLAARLYEVTHTIRRDLHAVERNRALVAGALGYRPDGPADYGIRGHAGAGDAARYAVLLPATSREDKLWPLASWVGIARELEAGGLPSVIPWGSDAERVRSETLAAELKMARVPARAPLADVARLLSGAAVVVGVDTGLTHLAAALGVPVVALYCGSDPALTGVYGAPRARNLGTTGALPEPPAVMAALRELGIA